MSKILLLFLISYLIFRWFLRPFFRPRHHNRPGYGSKSTDQKRKEGDVNMSGKPQGNKKVFDKSEGDYVDYEEVD